MPLKSHVFAWVLVLVALASPLAAHPDLEERIARLTEQLRAAPDDTALLTRRGRLYHDHGEWANALADFDHALALDPGLDGLHLMRSATLARAGRAGAALEAADLYLSCHPLHAEGLVLRARALVALGEPRRAAADLDEAIQRLPNPSIDLLVERARALAAGEAPDLEAALASLDDATAQVGPVLSLRLEAVTLAHALARDDLALPRLADLIRETPHPARLLQLQAQMLFGAGRTQEALEAVEQAIVEIDGLPARARARPAILDLHASLTRQADALLAGEPLPPTPQPHEHSTPPLPPEPHQ